MTAVGELKMRNKSKDSCQFLVTLLYSVNHTNPGLVLYKISKLDHIAEFVDHFSAFVPRTKLCLEISESCERA